MPVRTNLAVEDAEAIVRDFSLVGVTALEPIAGGAVNSNYILTVGGADLFLRVYEESDLEGARYEARLAAHLAARGVPTPVPLRTRSGGFATVRAGKPVALFPRVSGSEVCQARVSPGKARRIGQSLARIHEAGADFPDPRPGRFTLPDMAERLRSVSAPDLPEVRAAVVRLEREIEGLMGKRVTGLPSGTVHGDLFRDNVRWEGDEIVAVLDFESASHGPFAYDLAVGILAWCFADRFVPPLVAAMLEGYESVRPLEPVERDALLTEACVACVRFVTTRITDVELRPPVGRKRVKDFRRFLARLDTVEGALG